MLKFFIKYYIYLTLIFNKYMFKKNKCLTNKTPSLLFFINKN